MFAALRNGQATSPAFLPPAGPRRFVICALPQAILNACARSGLRSAFLPVKSRERPRLRPHRLLSIVSIEAAVTHRARHIVSDPINLLALLVWDAHRDRPIGPNVADN
jgi:hypothetical protein